MSGNLLTTQSSFYYCFIQISLSYFLTSTKYNTRIPKIGYINPNITYLNSTFNSENSLYEMFVFERCLIHLSVLYRSKINKNKMFRKFLTIFCGCEDERISFFYIVLSSMEIITSAR